MLATILMFFCGLSNSDGLNAYLSPPAPVETIPYADSAANEEASAADAATDADPATAAEPVDEPPKYWLGVHVVAIPEPLAAHVGKDGLMIMNIVKGSPADTAGLERYDIVRSYNGKPVKEMSDLVEAIQAAGGKAGKLEVVRGGKNETLKLTAVERPDTSSVEYKYEEPEAAQTAPFGGALRVQRDPVTGAMKIEPFSGMGPMGGMSGMAPGINPDWLQPFLQHLQDLDENGGDATDEDDNSTDKPQADVQIQINNNGEKLSIHHTSDGKFEVQRTDAGGKTSSATYDSAKAFRAGDHDAYLQYRRSSGQGARIRIWSNGNQKGGNWQKEFQQEIQNQLNRQPAPQPPQPPVTPRSSRSNMRVPGTSVSTSVSVGDDGGVHIVITENGKTSTYQFGNLEELKTKEPKLYERVRPLLGQQGACLPCMSLAAA